LHIFTSILRIALSSKINLRRVALFCSRDQCFIQQKIYRANKATRPPPIDLWNHCFF